MGFPMHVDFSHWVLAVADFRSKTITSYDSMGNTHQASLEAILAYLDSEHKATKGLKLKGFWMCQAADCPQQENTVDCGVFLCRIAESLTREAGSGTFTQADMPYLRRRCLFEIIRGKLLVEGQPCRLGPSFVNSWTSKLSSFIYLSVVGQRWRSVLPNILQISVHK